MNKDYWLYIKPFLPPLIFSVFFLAGVIIFKPSLFWLIIIISLLTLYSGFRALTPIKELLKKLFVNNLFLLIIVFLWRFLGSRGFIGFLSAILIVVGVILYRRRKLFIKTIRDVEVMLFGHTNDRKR